MDEKEKLATESIEFKVEKALAILYSECDTVNISISKYFEKEDRTIVMHRGRGNDFAREAVMTDLWAEMELG